MSDQALMTCYQRALRTLFDALNPGAQILQLTYFLGVGQLAANSDSSLKDLFFDFAILHLIKSWALNFPIVNLKR